MPAPFAASTSAIHDLEEKIGLETGFFTALYDEDDWSFVIKLHALLEAACTHLLLFHFNEPELADLFARLELSGKTVGKTVFLGKLGLLGKEWRRFVSALSELRNDLVHDIRQSTFSLAQFVESLDPTAVKNFAIAFSPHESVIRLLIDLPTKNAEEQARTKETTSVAAMIRRASTYPKDHIWIGAYLTLVHIVEMEGYSDYKQAVRARRTFGEDDDAPA